MPPPPQAILRDEHLDRIHSLSDSNSGLFSKSPKADSPSKSDDTVQSFIIIENIQRYYHEQTDYTELTIAADALKRRPPATVFETVESAQQSLKNSPEFNRYGMQYAVAECRYSVKALQSDGNNHETHYSVTDVLSLSVFDSKHQSVEATGLKAPAAEAAAPTGQKCAIM